MQLAAAGLTHRFPGRAELFTRLSLSVGPGELTALVGRSGSGKTTLLTILAGWVHPTGGHVTRDGIDRVVWVAQNPHGTPRRTALDHTVLPLLARGVRRREAEPAARQILERFGLDDLHDRQFRHLSGGEAGRLMLTCAVAADPDMLLIDEPTAQLDPASAADVVEVLHSLAGPGRIVIVATHDTRVREQCHTVIDLDAAASARS